MRATRLLILCAALATAACGSSPTSESPGTSADQRLVGERKVPDTAPDMRGTITRVLPGTGGPASGQPKSGGPNGSISCPPDCDTKGPTRNSILVEENPGELDSGGEKAFLGVTSSTTLLRRSGSGVVAITFADLRTGQKAEVWYDGAVALSYPVQGTAKVVVVE